ncbi:DEKNAAC100994 [Brettanomyces naardenensis]|uniref:DEKNAAC100994 n=1 Tax=Brettanomyces naardenensis TaxID=13370 RepID=A0A448YGS7_BRENA|nr:DEKNAAC100994 [Brettanomyces naardenensis]
MPSGYQICAKCKVKRRIYITDENPETLTRYKTCDACRQKNKQYKRKQKMRREARLRRGSSETEGEQMILLENEGSSFDRFEDFLYPLSQNDVSNVHCVKFSTVIPDYIIPRYRQTEDLVNPDANEKRIRDYREDVKAKLRVHYLNRIYEVLSVSGYTFKTRSTNWKSSKFYSQMLCSEDSGAKKKDLTEQISIDLSDPNPLYPCRSHLNYSFDSISGHFQLDFTHLCHQTLLPSTGDFWDTIKPPQSRIVKLVGDQRQGSSQNEEPSVDAEGKRHLSAFANALNDLHRKLLGELGSDSEQATQRAK